MAAGFVNQQAYMPQQGFLAQQLRPGNRTTHKKKKPRTGLMLAGLFLIVIAIAIASTAADKSGAAPLIVLGIVLLLISSASRKRRSGNDPRTDYDNTNYGHTDRDNNGIDDRNDNDSDSGNDSGDNDSDSGSNDD